MEKKIIDARGLACPLPVVNAKKAIGEFQEDGILTVLVDNEIAVQNLKKFAGQRGMKASGEKKAEKEFEVTIQVAAPFASAVGRGAEADGTVRTAASRTAAAEKSAASGTAAATEKSAASGTAAAEKSAVSETMAETEIAQASGAGASGENEEEAELASCVPDSRKQGMTVVLSADVMGGGDEKLGRTLMKAFIFALTKQDLLPETILCYNSGAYLTCEGSESLEDIKSLEAEGVTIMTCGTCLDFYGIKDKLAVGTVTNMYEIVETMENSRELIRP